MISQRAQFLKYLAQTSDFPMMVDIARAEGIFLYDHEGKSYIDAIAGISVSTLGHQHPEIIKALKEQIDKHAHVMVYGEFIQPVQVQLAKELIASTPEGLDQVFFVNSGSEAVEGAMKLAKRFTGRPDIVACKNAYHGSSHGALSVSGNERLKQAFRPLVPGIKHIRFGNIEDLESINENTAAMIIETVQGEAGVRMAGHHYFQALKQRCIETDALLIMDEIQAGFGRTGKFWAFEHYDIVPDIIVTAKGMGGGMPLGGFIAGEQVMGMLKDDPILGHISTFGGHPVSAAASLATIRVLKEGNIIEEVEHKGRLLENLLKDVKTIREIRRKGLMMALETGSFEKTQQVIHQAVDLGLISDWFLFCDTAIRIAPPLVISESEIHQMAHVIKRSFA